MNKKRAALPLLAACLALPILTSCGEKITEVALPFGQLYDSSSSVSDTDHFRALAAHSDLKSKVEAEDSFVLIVLPKDLGCTCWSNFCATINRYQAKKNLLIYSIGADQFDDSSVSKFSLDVDAHLADVAIFENGTLKYQQKADGTSDSFAKDLTVFSDWMNARLSFSDMLYVNKTQMDALYAGTTPFTLGFVRTTCGDCSYVESNFLKEYNKTSHSVSYLIDCDVNGIRYFNGSAPSSKDTATADEKAASTQWKTFKDDYGLSNEYDTDFGYDGGFVPTWFHLNPSANTETKPWGAIDDADVYFNDTVIPDSGSYKVSSSFFDGKRNLLFLGDADALQKGGCTTTTLTGLALDSSQIDVYHLESGDYYVWNHEAAAKYHDPLLKSFLEKYIAMN